MPLPRDDHVLRLDVAVDHAPVVAMSEGSDQLPCPAKNFLFGHFSLLGDDFIQPPAVDKVHHQIGVTVFFKVIADTGQVGVAQPGQQLRFLLELFAKFRQRTALGARIGDHLLERTADVEHSVHRFVDGAHATLAHQGDDTVATVNYLSWDEGHCNSTFQICSQETLVQTLRLVLTRLARFRTCGIILLPSAGVVQLVERLLAKEKVTGSSPVARSGSSVELYRET